MQQIPPPNIKELLIPVIACLPAAFISPLPPPALLSYLSPIIRQRISFLSSSRQSSNSRSYEEQSDSKWLHLLTWSPARAKELNEIVGRMQLEPHPVSGEIELFEDDISGEEGKIKYRRLDSETVQAKCDVAQHAVSVVWVWCTNIPPDDGLETGQTTGTSSGWRVAEVLPFPCEDAESEEQRNSALQWYDSLEEAEEAAKSNVTADESTDGMKKLKVNEGTNKEADDDNDDAYWAAYDNTPSNRTPAENSPTPHPNRPQPLSTADPEDDYYARYGSEVQPAMDAHDPDEEQEAENHGHTLAGQNGEAGTQLREDDMQRNVPPPLGLGSGGNNDNLNSPGALFSPEKSQSNDFVPIHSPAASRPTSPSRQSHVEALEASAMSSSAAEVGVKQHISTEMKSLYRLARASGIDRNEFERIIRTELDVLGMLDS